MLARLKSQHTKRGVFFLLGLEELPNAYHGVVVVNDGFSRPHFMSFAKNMADTVEVAAVGFSIAEQVGPMKLVGVAIACAYGRPLLINDAFHFNSLL